MLRIWGLILAGVLVFGACEKKENPGTSEFRSMEQIHAEEGIPVRVRTVGEENFSARLKYPAELRARSESTAYASLTDVVRRVGYNVGDYVQKDAVVTAFSPDNPAYRQARTAMENAEAAFKRSESLLAGNGISRQNYDNARAQYDMAVSAHKAADDMIRVKAPISGYLTKLVVGETGNVESGDALFTISNLELIEGRIWVSAGEIGQIRLGQIAEVEWLGKRIRGRVTRVNLIMDTEKKAFLVIAEFPNPERLLTSGLTADIDIEVYRREGAVVAGRRELLREAGGYHAFIAKDGMARRIDVSVGRDQGFLFEITKGLEPGDLLITEGNHMVADGVGIRIIP